MNIFILLFELLGKKQIEITTDHFGNAQIVIPIDGYTWYFTHDKDEGNYYISRWGLNDSLVLNRITKMTKRFGNDESFTAFIEKLKPTLIAEGYCL